MAFQDDIYPILRALQIFGLFPTGSLQIGTSGKKRPKIDRKHLIYPLMLALVSWFNGIRHFTLFGYFHMTEVGDIAYQLEITGFYMMCAVIRTSFLFNHWKGNKWLKTLDYLADADSGKLSNQKVHPLAFLNGIKSDNKEHQRSKSIIAIQVCCWVFLLFDVVFSMTLSVIKKESFGGMMTPFNFIFFSDNNSYYTAVSFIGIASSISTSAAIICNCLIICLTFELVKRFRHVEKWVNVQRKQHERRLMAKFGHHSDASVETIEANTDNSGNCFPIEKLHNGLLFLINGVHKLDKVARVPIAVTMMLGFFALLVNMYRIGWGTTDDLIKFMLAFWLCASAFFLSSHLISSAYLNEKVTEVQQAILRMPPAIFAGPNGSHNPARAVQVSLLLGQFTAEPVALTFCGLLVLRSEAIVELLDAVLTYFLILLNYTAGEKRGKSNIEAATALANATAS